jgi:hypothetical protein
MLTAPSCRRASRFRSTSRWSRGSIPGCVDVSCDRSRPIRQLASFFRSAPTQSYSVIGRFRQILARAQILLGNLNAGMSEQHLNLFEVAAAGAAELGAGPPQVARSNLSKPSSVAYRETISKIIGAESRRSAAFPSRPTARNTGPSPMPAASIHRTIASFAHGGSGTRQVRPCVPITLSNTHRPSCRCKSSTFRQTTSLLRSPHLTMRPRIARSRLPFGVFGSGAFISFSASSAVNQFPDPTPRCLTPRIRRILAACLTATSPWSVAVSWLALDAA